MLIPVSCQKNQKKGKIKLLDGKILEYIYFY